MDEIINNLLDKILIIQQDDYRVGDILFKKGPRWKYSGKKILSDKKYNGSIIKKYLKINGLNSKFDLKSLLNITQEYNNNNNLPIPSGNELVLHLRLGDYMEYKGILNKPYIKLIRQYIKTNPNINKITITTAFSYGTWTGENLHLKPKDTPMWKCTKKTQMVNIKKMRSLIKKIYKNFPNIILEIISNSVIDKDICYCVNSEYFINDVGGFSNLMLRLNKLRKLQLNDVE